VVGVEQETRLVVMLYLAVRAVAVQAVEM